VVTTYVEIGIFLAFGITAALLLHGATRRSNGTLDELRTVRVERNALQSDLQQARTALSAAREGYARLEGQQQEVSKSLEAKVQECATLGSQITSLRTRLEAEASASTASAAKLSDRDAAIVQLQGELTEKEAELQQLRETVQGITAREATLNANLAHAERANAEIKAFITDMQTRLSGVFGDIATKAFQERAQVLEKNMQVVQAQSKTDIEGMLKPFSDRIAEFRQRVDTLYGDEAKERATLLGAVTELKSLNQTMATEAAALTRALKGSAKVRGDWGELMLDSVLRGSGLEEGTHYQRQKSTTDESGNRLQPDVVVKLPDGRLVVVDSKVNLIAWQEAMNAQTPDEQQEALRRHAVALRQHIRDLGEKNYPKALGSDALEITIAFVPIEGALSAALGTDGALQAEAFDRGIAFASPNTLMALLRVVERLWTREKIQRQAVEISEAGGRVLDALTRFLNDFDTVGKRLNDATTAFGDARRSLSESQQAVIPRARRLAELGPRGKKALPAELSAVEEQPLTSPVTSVPSSGAV
jgi:DNA recombination protein RmuC